MNLLEPTVDEIMATCISHQVSDGEVLAQGINTPLVMAGFILAKCTHAPNIRFASAIGQGICEDWSPLSIVHAETFWLENALINVGFATATADLLPKYNPKEFFRPAQVDMHGNFNNIAIGKDYHKPRLRLPGTGGIPDVTTYSSHVYLYVPRHSRISFPKSLDFISGLGHMPQRTQGNGPQYLISNLGQFDWHNGRMRLTSQHPDITLERIRAKTAFELEIASDIQQTPPPTQEEIRLLREEIDPLNVRKLELLAGNARKNLLKKIVMQESESHT